MSGFGPPYCDPWALYYGIPCESPSPQVGALTQAQLQANLADAQTQYHLLMTGQQASVFVDSNGERITYTAANRDDLYDYIQSLLAAVNPSPCGTTSSGPIGFLF